MRRSGHADMPLHGGKVPMWLAERMEKLGSAITEAVITEYGRDAFLQRLSDPLWFQALGCVLGMDWHSSGITTSVMGALKRGINKNAQTLGIYVCGGRGRHSRKTPEELLRIADRTGLDGVELVKSSRLSAKIDNTAVQDGFQIYLHNFVLSIDGAWTVVQQGMNTDSGTARRYHWHSNHFESFISSPHAGVTGLNQGKIMNLVHSEAQPTQSGVLDIASLKPHVLMKEARHLTMPGHHDVRLKDVDMRRLGAVVTLSQERGVSDFESLLLTEGLGPRTLQSLALVSEVVHGTPSRFEDPARFSFAHGGKDGHPFPVPTSVYDQTISVLNKALERAKIGQTEQRDALKRLHGLAQRLEDQFTPSEGAFDQLVERERKDSHHYGGRTVDGFVKPPSSQLDLFD